MKTERRIKGTGFPSPTASTRLPEIIHTIWWTSDFAGDVPADELKIVGGEELKSHELLSETTYDGMSAFSRGHYEYRVLSKPFSIAKLEELGADFGICRNGYQVGCWINERPTRFDENYSGCWTWNEEERNYLQSTFRLIF